VGLEKGVSLLVSEVVDLQTMLGPLDGRSSGLAKYLDHFKDQHLTAENAAKIAAAAGVGKLVFTHISSRQDTDKIASKLIRDAQTYYQGPVIVARDLDRF